MTTANDIISLALKSAGVVGVGQSALAEDINDSFNVMNMMIGQWAAKRYLVYHLLDISKASTGAQSYTVGTGMDFNCSRPNRIEKAFIRQLTNTSPNQVDFPVDVLESYEDYSTIRVKQMGTMPSFAFYDPGYPVGTIYFWPVPSAIYEMHILVKAPLQSFASLSDTINLPPEYQEALHYNLAARLRPLFGLDVDQATVMLAMQALNTIKTANAAIPRLKMPTGLVRRSAYNVFSDGNG